MFGLKLFKKNLLNLLPEVRGKYTPNVRLAKYTWFGVGGPAEVLYTPADAEDLSHFLKNKPYNLPICVIGGGSNLLVRDGGVPGVVIRLDRVDEIFLFISHWDLAVTHAKAVRRVV